MALQGASLIPPAAGFGGDKKGLQRMKEVFTEGDGPFITPLVAAVVGIRQSAAPDVQVIEFRCEDGAALLLPISAQTAEHLGDLLAVLASRKPSPPGPPQ